MLENRRRSSEVLTGSKSQNAADTCSQTTGNIPLRKRAGGAFVQTGNKEYVELNNIKKQQQNNRRQRHVNKEQDNV